MATHNTYATPRVVVVKESVECYVNAVIVKRACQSLVYILGILAHQQVILIGAAIIAVVVRFLVGFGVARRLITSI